MYVQKIHIKSFRHLENVTLGPFALPPKSSDLVVLAGPNGGGKSSILELLGYALSNTWALSRTFPTNSFEVALAVAPEERQLIRDHIRQNADLFPDEMREYFENNSVYYRAYNYEEGQYQPKAPLYNQIHNLVTVVLRNQYRRSLGFFLKSDRFYPIGAFDRSRLFQYEQIITQDYIWNVAFNTSDIQYRDMFEFLIQQRYHYFRRLGEYHHRERSGGNAGVPPPTDPLLPYDQLLQKLFPGYSFADSSEEVPTNLFIKIPSGEAIPFQDLSSGEKEVFFILSFFLRHDVSNAVIVIDEPELHLHPELARLLVRTMQSIKPGNQIWLGTHNPEIIDEAGRDRVVYISRDPATLKSKVTKGTEESSALRILKDMFGYSGYIGIAKRMVFLEGEHSSVDRKVFLNVFPEYSSTLKLIPANSSENQTRINAAILSILEADLGWAQFYLLRDRDYLTPEFVTKYNEHASGKVYVLKRHEIENYLLVDDLIAKVQTEIFGKPTTADEVKTRFRGIARKISGEVLREMVSFRLNLIYQPSDFSFANLLQGQPIIDGADGYDEAKINALETALTVAATEITVALSASTSPEALKALISRYKEEVRTALISDDDTWRILFPGKRLLEEYAKIEGLGEPLVLQNSLIKEMSASTDLVPTELRDVVAKIADGLSLADDFP